MATGGIVLAPSDERGYKDVSAELPCCHLLTVNKIKELELQLDDFLQNAKEVKPNDENPKSEECQHDMQGNLRKEVLKCSKCKRTLSQIINDFVCIGMQQIFNNAYGKDQQELDSPMVKNSGGGAGPNFPTLAFIITGGMHVSGNDGRTPKPAVHPNHEFGPKLDGICKRCKKHISEIGLSNCTCCPLHRITEADVTPDKSAPDFV